MSITVEEKNRVMKEFATKDGDTGSPEVQVAILTSRIRTLTEHFAATRSPIADYTVLTVGLRLPGDVLRMRISDRVERQFDRGLVDEVRALLTKGVRSYAGPFGGLVYRQVLEYLDGRRDLEATRGLIIRENQRYARRQLIWFQKEPNLHWLGTPGHHPETRIAVTRLLDTVVAMPSGR